MDGWLGGCAALFFTARAPVSGDDGGRMWDDSGRSSGGSGGGIDEGGGSRPAAYGVIERLLSPLRRRRVREEWSVREVAVFEVGMCQLPKDFAAISRLIGSKTTSEVVHFYYTAWKHTQHYWRWKQASSCSAAQQSQQPSVDGRSSRVEIVLNDDDEQTVESSSRSADVTQLTVSVAVPVIRVSPRSGSSSVVSAPASTIPAAGVDDFGAPSSKLEPLSLRQDEQAVRDNQPHPQALTAGGEKG